MGKITAVIKSPSWSSANGFYCEVDYSFEGLLVGGATIPIILGSTTVISTKASYTAIVKATVATDANSKNGTSFVSGDVILL